VFSSVVVAMGRESKFMCSVSDRIWISRTPWLGMSALTRFRRSINTILNIPELSRNLDLFHHTTSILHRLGTLKVHAVLSAHRNLSRTGDEDQSFIISIDTLVCQEYCFRLDVVDQPEVTMQYLGT
jgi:hypothetical protein